MSSLVSAEEAIRPPTTWTGPVPADEDWTAPFWAALRRHEMSVQRCVGCRAWQWPPVLACPDCYSEELVFEPVAGSGHVYAVTISHREFGLNVGVPWIAAYVELDEGPRMATLLFNTSVDSVAIGDRVSVLYGDYDNIGLTLAFFEPEAAPR